MPVARPVEPSDLLRFQTVSDPRIAPDGSRVAYVVTSHNLNQEKPQSAIWIVQTRYGTPRRLTNPREGSDRSPRWSPDGTRLAFVSTRKGRPQIWLIDPTGGEARSLETEQAVISEPVWSPDGRQIAFAAAVYSKASDWTPYPGAPAGDRERAATSAAPAKKENGRKDLGVKVITRLQYKLDGLGFFGDLRSQIFVIAADGSGPARQITEGDYDHQFPAWSPDGRSIYCAARRDGDADYHNRRDLWRFSLEGGPPALVLGGLGPILNPAVSPDGSRIAFIGHDNRHFVSTAAQVMVLTLKGGVADGPPYSLTAPLDRDVSFGALPDIVTELAMPVCQWTPDGRGLYFLIADRGDAYLFFAEASGGLPVRLSRGEERSVGAFSVSLDGSAALLVGDAVTPPEVAFLQDGEERRLTDHNRWAREQLELVRPERFQYAGADGWPVEGFLIRPVGHVEGGRCPVVVLVHGGPHAAYGSGLMVQAQALAGAGFAVLYTNPRGSTTYGQKFTLAAVADLGGADFVDILSGVDAAIARGVADPDRIGMAGWSYGGYMTCRAVTLTERIKAAVAGAPVVNQYSMFGTSDMPLFAEWIGGGLPHGPEGEERLLAQSPVRGTSRVTTPTLLLVGENDLRCPASQAEEFYVGLRRWDRASAVLVRYPGESHGLSRPAHRLDRLERTLAWFRYWLGPAGGEAGAGGAR